MEKSNYDPEIYWSEVGVRISERESGDNVIAGDDEPYYRYKRDEFLKLLTSIDFTNKSVLEIGCGPGGNLLQITNRNPSKLVGVDISNEMVTLARKKLPGEVEVIKIDGTTLPFEDNAFDIVFTATVLQHNTDDKMLRQIMAELCRVCSGKVYLFERIEGNIKGDDLCLGRPIPYYSSIMKDHGFVLQSKSHINIRVSYYVCGAIRKGLNPKSRKEGEPINKVSTLLQNLTLPFTKVLDKVFRSGKDLAKLEFKRK